MGAVTRITPEIEAELPAEMKAELGLKPGDGLRFVRQENGSWVVQKARRSFDGIAGNEEGRLASARGDERGHGNLESLRGIVRPRVPVTGALIDQWSREAREGADLSDET